MKREQRHTVHYLAARARKGDEWAHALLARLVDLSSESAEAGGLGTACQPLPLSEAPGSLPLVGDMRPPDRSEPPPFAARPRSHQGCAAGVGAVPATASTPPSQTK